MRDTTRQRNYGPKDPKHGRHALMLLPGIPVTRNVEADRGLQLCEHYVGKHRRMVMSPSGTVRFWQGQFYRGLETEPIR